MRVLILLFMTVSLSACTTVGLIASPSRQFVTTDTLQLSSKPANFYNTVVEVGKSLKYEHAGGNRATNTVNFTDNAGLGMGVLVGKVSNFSMAVSLSGRTVNFDVQATGNFSTAKEEKITARLNEFKDGLRAKFGA